MINIGLVKLPSQESPKVGRQEANFAIYFANFTLTNENNISSTQTGTKLLYKYKHFFFIKNGNLIINWISYKHTVPERLSFQSDKYEIKGTLKKNQFTSSSVNYSHLFCVDPCCMNLFPTCLQHFFFNIVYVP